MADTQQVGERGRKTSNVTASNPLEQGNMRLYAAAPLPPSPSPLSRFLLPSPPLLTHCLVLNCTCPGENSVLLWLPTNTSMPAAASATGMRLAMRGSGGESRPLKANHTSEHITSACSSSTGSRGAAATACAAAAAVAARVLACAELKGCPERGRVGGVRRGGGEGKENVSSHGKHRGGGKSTKVIHSTVTGTGGQV